MVNEWDFVRFGTISDDEQIIATDPPQGYLDSVEYPEVDRFSITFDSANNIYVDDITVQVTGGVAPEVEWDLRHGAHEILFTLLCFLDHARTFHNAEDFANEVPALVEQFLLGVSRDTGHAAWMAGDLLGHHRGLRVGIPSLTKVVREARYVAGRADGNPVLRREVVDVTGRVSLFRLSEIGHTPESTGWSCDSRTCSDGLALLAGATVTLRCQRRKRAGRAWQRQIPQPGKGGRAHRDGAGCMAARRREERVDRGEVDRVDFS